MKKVLIVGAGAQGAVLSWVLSRTDDISEVILGDIDPNRMKEIVAINKSNKLKVEILDAADVNGMTAFIKGGGVDLVLNAIPPQFNDQVMEACYGARTNYQDMAGTYFPGGDRNIPVGQLKYAKKWEEASLKASILTGCDVGASNLLAREAADELDEIDSIRIKDYNLAESEELISLWQPQTYLEDLSLPPVIWDNGYKEVPPFGGEEEYDFPFPISTKGKVYYHTHEEPLTIPKFIGKPVKYVDFKMGEPAIMFWKSLMDLGLMSKEPVEIQGKKIIPQNVLSKLLPPTPTAMELIELIRSGKLRSRTIMTVDAYGKKDGKDLHYRLWEEIPSAAAACERIPGASDVSYATAVQGAVFALMMLRGQVNHTGVFPPEVFNKGERDIYYKTAKEWDIKIHKEVETIV